MVDLGPMLLSLLLLAASSTRVNSHNHLTSRRFGGLRLQLSPEQGLSGFSASREVALWRSAMHNTMKQVKNVSWYLAWDELTSALERKEVPPRLVDNPDLQGRETQMMKLVNCINDKYNETAQMSWQAAMDDQPSSLRAVAAWWNNHEPDEPVTVVTSASVSRLPQLYAQCLSWSGPLSAVLYQALPLDNSTMGLGASGQSTLRTAVLQISQFVLDMQQVPGACKPDLILVHEVYSDESARKLLYPFNLLRNMARLQARTALLALLDVDLVLSRSMATRVNNPDRAAWLISQAKNNTVFIIPAFDVRGQHERAAWADALVSSSKEMLVFAYNKNIVCPFQQDAYPEGHGLTNHAYWKTAAGDYPVEHAYKCEPWLLGDRKNMPWHDARYRGYGLDKVQFVMDIAAHSMNFRVMHDVFTIHRAHKKGAARDYYIMGKIRPESADPSLYQHNWNLFSKQKELKELGKPWTPVTNPATQHCRDVLSWWRE